MKSQFTVAYVPPKEITRRNEEGDQITIHFIPLPAEKRAEWEQVMRLLTDIIFEIMDQRGAGVENKDNV